MWISVNYVYRLYIYVYMCLCVSSLLSVISEKLKYMTHLQCVFCNSVQFDRATSRAKTVSTLCCWGRYTRARTEDLISSHKTRRVAFLEIIFLARRVSKVADLYFIIRLSTIVNPNASYINCHPQLRAVFIRRYSRSKRIPLVSRFPWKDFSYTIHTFFFLNLPTIGRK